MPTSTKPDLPALVAEWQRRLRLQDWRIEAAYVKDLATSSGQPAYGLCVPFVDAKRARIAIRDPETSAQLGDGGPSVEETVVHELLHLHFAPLAGSTPAEVAAEEQAVWSIAEAIANAGGSSRDAAIRALLANVKAPRAPKEEAAMLAHLNDLRRQIAEVDRIYTKLESQRSSAASRGVCERAWRATRHAAHVEDADLVKLKNAFAALVGGDARTAARLLEELLASHDAHGASADDDAQSPQEEARRDLRRRMGVPQLADVGPRTRGCSQSFPAMTADQARAWRAARGMW